MQSFERQLKSTPIQDWKTYLRWQLLNAEAITLSQPFVDENFAFNQKQLAGVGELKPRETRCAEQTDQFLGEALGQEYVKRYFPPEAKQRATVMVTNIIASMHDTIEGLDWMTPATKEKAVAKLANLSVKVGYPDKWIDYSSVKITRGAYFEDTIAASRFSVADDHKKIGKARQSRALGHDPAHLERLLQPVHERDRLPRRNPSTSSLQPRQHGRGELWSHRRRHRA